MAMALAGLGMVGQSYPSLAKAANQVKTEQAAEISRKSKREAFPFTKAGGSTDPFGNPFGLTPKEYGMRYGNGGSKRSNRLRYSHNAKVKRRSAR